MIINGDYNTVIDILGRIKDCSHGRDDLRFSLSLLINGSDGELILADADTLQSIDKFDNGINQFYLIQKDIIDRINKTTESRSVIQNKQNRKTGSLLTQIESDISQMGGELAKAGNREYESLGIRKKEIYETEMVLDVSLNSDLYIIEEHYSDCNSANRPTVFAIKQMTDNYFLLFYRKSVYDVGDDRSFRKYLSMQPGELVAYRYCHSVNSIRDEFKSLNLSLRHNGKNELSKYQADHILRSFQSLQFL